MDITFLDESIERDAISRIFDLLIDWMMVPYTADFFGTLWQAINDSFVKSNRNLLPRSFEYNTTAARNGNVIAADKKLLSHVASLGYQIFLYDVEQQTSNTGELTNITTKYFYYDALRYNSRLWLALLRVRHSDKITMMYKAIHLPMTAAQDKNRFQRNNAFGFPILE
jgi:hypothetical protein